MGKENEGEINGYDVFSEEIVTGPEDDQGQNDDQNNQDDDDG